MLKLQKVVLLLDCAHSGSAVPTKPLLAGHVIIASCQASEISRERARWNGGLLTSRLIEALKQNSGFVSIEQVYGYLKDRVSMESGGKQNPVMHTGGQEANVVIGIGASNAR